MSRVIHNCEVFLGCELRVISCWVEREAGAKEIALVKPVQTEFHHLLGQLLILNLVLAIWVKPGGLVVPPKFEI